MIVTSLSLIILLALLFGRTTYGKALRATAINRVGARLVGISYEFSGRLSFALAALIGAVSGILVSPITTIYYDTGFMISLKGFNRRDHRRHDQLSDRRRRLACRRLW